MLPSHDVLVQSSMEGKRKGHLPTLTPNKKKKIEENLAGSPSVHFAMGGLNASASAAHLSRHTPQLFTFCLCVEKTSSSVAEMSMDVTCLQSYDVMVPTTYNDIA